MKYVRLIDEAKTLSEQGDLAGAVACLAEMHERMLADKLYIGAMQAAGCLKTYANLIGTDPLRQYILNGSADFEAARLLGLVRAKTPWEERYE